MASMGVALANCSWPVDVIESGFDGTLYLRTSSKEINIDMDSGQSGEFVFSGDVEATLERALELLNEFSQGLTSGGFVHRIELSNESHEQVGYFNHAWPENQWTPD